MKIQPLDIRDISIIDAFPNYNYKRIVLNVGCGEGRIDFHIAKLGYKVYATDHNIHENWNGIDNCNGLLEFSKADIFDISTFPIKASPIVICSEVLEHLRDYKNALKNLLKLTQIRLIITIPYKTSFNVRGPPPKGHINHWNDRKSIIYKNVKEFHKLCFPYSVTISKIRTKPRDVQMKQYGYLIVVDKRQNLIYR